MDCHETCALVWTRLTNIGVRVAEDRPQPQERGLLLSGTPDNLWAACPATQPVAVGQPVEYRLTLAALDHMTPQFMNLRLRHCPREEALQVFVRGTVAHGMTVG